MYYFAYGSNLNHTQMKLRCPLAKFICAAKLDGYKLQYDGYSHIWKGPGANIIKGKGTIWGGIYEFEKESDLSYLDKCEGLKIGIYKRVLIDVVTNDNKIINSWIYIKAKKEKLGKPSKKYLNTILIGIKNCQIPEEYKKVICQI